MSKRHDSVQTNYYTPFLNASDQPRMGNNTSENRLWLHEMMHTRILTELVLHRFEWENLPETVDVRWMELALTNNGHVVFYKHPDNERFLVSKTAHNGYINHYDNPTSFTVIANRLRSIKLDPHQCVPIWNNYLRTPEFDIIAVYAYKLASIDIDIEIAADNLRQTNVVAVPDGQRQTWLNIARQRKAGEPLIFGSNGLDVDAIVPLDLGADPDALDKLLIARTKVMNDCMTTLGIDNANVDKKERLVTEEVTANHEQVSAMMNIALKSRMEAADQINEMFGLDISVRPATSPENDGQGVVYDGEDLEAEGGEDDNGDVHGDDSRNNE